MENNSIPVEKNKEYVVEIIDNGYEGEGIAKIDDYTIFIPGAIKGEKCKILIVKVNKNFAYGKLLENITKSQYRKDTDCSTYKRCGGCELRHIEYQYTLELKKNNVQNLVNKGLKEKINVSDVIGMEAPLYYRNKLQYPVGQDISGKPAMGVFAKRSHEIIPTNECLIQNKKAQEVANFVFEQIKENNVPVYNEKTQKGQVRHIIIKIGIKTNEIMCILVTNEKTIKNEQEVVSKIISKYPDVKTIVKNINNKNTNVILGRENEVLFGDGYIIDELAEYKFKIFPMSFYQTNPAQTEKLYNKAIEFANLKKTDVLADLYCGIGTIGIFAAKYVKKVYGIEIVEDAIEAAKENAKLNNVENIEFLLGDVEEVFNSAIEKKTIIPSVIIVDPPRKGLDTKTIQTMLNLNISRIVYVSCNPATMVRDLNLLEEKYNIEKIQPVDMFPFTTHVESICVLKLK